VHGPAEVAFEYQSLDSLARKTRICFAPQPAKLDETVAEFELDLAARERRPIALTVQCLEGGSPPAAERRFFVVRRLARRTLAEAREAAPLIETSNTVVNSVLERSSADLAMLMTETLHGPYPYAGVPWFSTAFGRDGILTAIEMLWVEPAVARGVLRFLAAHQATREDPGADMEPGKILHELRECELARLGEVPFGRYYGSIDATPLFIALAGMYWERTRDRATLEAIWPNIKAALDWIERAGDRDGDGFVEYDRRRASGLRNQGWKDSDDAVFHADGSLATGPIALCEVQGYVYLAYRVAARLAADMDDYRLSAGLTIKAEALRRQFEETFWDEELGTYALALDGDKRACLVRTSNAGQLLFTGITAPERAARVVAGLFDPDCFSGWGIRTVNRRERRFNPASYHNGSVWPHDNALIALGLARYGHCSEALELTTALFDAAAHMHLRRLPELFCGFERQRGKAPTLYPVACAPQAWAAVTPFALIQACLGLEVDCGAGKLRLRKPRLPQFLDWMAVKRLRLGEASVDLMLRRHDSSVAVNLLARNGAAEVEVML
jgi:glycogen debranching enzyme